MNRNHSKKNKVKHERRTDRKTASATAPPVAPAPVAMRLQKLLAEQGLGSRREIESWIAAGEISVNGQTAQLGAKASVTDNICRLGKPLSLKSPSRPTASVWLYHKPVGEVCTRFDPEGRPTIFANLPRRGRLISVGRLDLNTAGLLLLTTDGELAHRLMHPSHAIPRVYAVRVVGEVAAETLERLRTGVQLDDGPARFDTIEVAGGQGLNRWYHVRLHEGRNREVRRLWDSQGVTVSRLIRIGYGPIALDRDLPTGRFRPLGNEEIDALYRLVELTRPETEAPAYRRRSQRAKMSPHIKQDRH